jgi:ADP-ribose pyrophosphatase YjhB (NUDIX family)
VAEFTTPPLAPAHVALATVFQVRDGDLSVLLWERARDPHSGAWALPGGTLAADETLEESILRHLATKVDLREVSHLEQLGTWSEPDRHPERWELATAYLGLVPHGVDPQIPDDTRWHPVEAMPPTAFDHGAIVLAGRDRLRAKLSYSNIGFALAPETFTLAELRDVYEAALDQPQARAAAPGRDRVGWAQAGARSGGGSPGRAVPVPGAPVRGHGSVRGVPSTRLRRFSRAAPTPIPRDMRHFRTLLLAIGLASLAAEAVAAAALFWRSDAQATRS